MLVEFSVENFRSIRDRQTLSLVPSRASSKSPAYTLQTGREDIPALLRVAAIFGANASGKTTVLQAINSIRNFVRGSAMERLHRQPTICEPFALSDEKKDSPSSFEVTFIVSGTLYQFGCVISKERVIEEWLHATGSSGAAKTLYSRELKHGESGYTWKIDLPNVEDEQEKLWMVATRDNALFLSTAVQLNSALLRPVYDWFSKGTWLLSTTAASRFSRSRDTTRHMLHRDREQYLGRVLDFLNASDLRIVDVEVDAIKMSGISSNEIERLAVRMGHRNDQGKTVYLDEFDESSGTLRLFTLAGRFLTAWEQQQMLLVDELDASVHPLAASNLIGMFNDARRNESRSQLIFTSHNPALLRSDVLHRDQIWFTERDNYQASRIMALSDFEVRSDTAREDRYLAGRYGGIPLIRLRLSGALGDSDGSESEEA